MKMANQYCLLSDMLTLRNQVMNLEERLQGVAQLETRVSKLEALLQIEYSDPSMQVLHIKDSSGQVTLTDATAQNAAVLTVEGIAEDIKPLLIGTSVTNLEEEADTHQAQVLAQAQQDTTLTIADNQPTLTQKEIEEIVALSGGTSNNGVIYMYVVGDDQQEGKGTIVGFEEQAQQSADGSSVAWTGLSAAPPSKKPTILDKMSNGENSLDKIVQNQLLGSVIRDDLCDADGDNDCQLDPGDGGKDISSPPPALATPSSGRGRGRRRKSETVPAASPLILNEPRRTRGRPGKDFPLLDETKLKNITSSGRLVSKQEKTTKGKEKAEQPLPYKCDKCAERFSKKRALIRHQTSHDDVVRPYICKECGMSFRRKPTLHAHRFVHSGERPYKCKDCNKSYTKAYDLKCHQRVHTGETPFVCCECGKGFRRTTDLYSHVRSHAGEKPHKCPICSKCYNRTSHLATHLKTHTDSSHACNICGKSFVCEMYLKRHLKTQHHQVKTRVCSVCGKKFNHLYSLQVHMRTHTGDKPYMCCVCGTCFTQACSLKSHIRTHTGEAMYACNVCGRQFVHRSSWAKHKETHARRSSASEKVLAVVVPSIKEEVVDVTDHISLPTSQPAE